MTPPRQTKNSVSDSKQKRAKPWTKREVIDEISALIYLDHITTDGKCFDVQKPKLKATVRKTAHDILKIFAMMNDEGTLWTRK